MSLAPRTIRLPATILLLALLIALTAIGVRADTAVSPLPPPTGFVNDYAGVIDAATKSRLETILTNLKKVANIEFAVVTVRTTGNTDIYNYSLAVARGWGIGAPDGEQNGLLLLLAIDDRKYITQVSRHLEGDLPDGLVGQIQRAKLVPQLKAQRYSQGISDTVETYIATLAEARGFNVEGIDQRKAFREPAPSGEREGPIRTRKSSPFTLIIILVVVFLVISSLARRGGGGGSGCLSGFLLGNILSSGGRGGWGGGSSGWGGGGFGGFGGGGSFGGGGAGGSW